MNTAKPKLMSNVKHDDMQTPPYAITPILPFLNKENTIWECACGKGNLVKAFRDLGYKVIGTDIEHDFLKNDLHEHWDCIVTNPPYSLKDEWIARCYELGKPFALLMPLTALEGIFRGALYKKYGVQLIIPNRRVNFITPNGGSSSWFQTAWFCYRLKLPTDLMFVNMERDEIIKKPTQNIIKEINPHIDNDLWKW